MANNAGFDEAFAEIRAEALRNNRRRAEDFAALLRQRIPRRKQGLSRGTAQKVRIEGSEDSHLAVVVPFPWYWNEFGSLHQKANPVVRRTLAENEMRYQEMMNGSS